LCRPHTCTAVARVRGQPAQIANAHAVQAFAVPSRSGLASAQ
jgi:hypothetical protein